MFNHIQSTLSFRYIFIRTLIEAFCIFRHPQLNRLRLLVGSFFYDQQHLLDCRLHDFSICRLDLYFFFLLIVIILLLLILLTLLILDTKMLVRLKGDHLGPVVDL